ncbi:hypothetical protein [Epilithonimonas sp. UC225_85]|uniref:hypothetical protein n=1 Tax=Epilithonimonas sp. UC225_85 TaxID=3350167 RepID=UPI0036D418B5
MKNFFPCLILLLVVSCKKEAQLNDGIHEDLVESKLAKDSLQKMDVVLDKLNKKNTTFLDYYVHYYYGLDQKAIEEFHKIYGEDIYYGDKEYITKFDSISHILSDKYNKEIGLSDDEEMLAREIYINHLKVKYNPTVESQMKSIYK